MRHEMLRDETDSPIDQVNERPRHGTVKMVNLAKGWGFIRPETGVDVFFHRSVVRGQPWEFVEQGQPVTFDVGERRDGKGPRAEAVWFQ